MSGMTVSEKQIVWMVRREREAAFLVEAVSGGEIESQGAGVPAPGSVGIEGEIRGGLNGLGREACRCAAGRDEEESAGCNYATGEGAGAEKGAPRGTTVAFAEWRFDEAPGERGENDGCSEYAELCASVDGVTAGERRAGLDVVEVGEYLHGPVPEVERVRNEPEEHERAQAENAADK